MDGRCWVVEQKLNGTESPNFTTYTLKPGWDKPLGRRGQRLVWTLPASSRRPDTGSSQREKKIVWIFPGESEEIPANYVSEWRCKEQNSGDEHTWPLENHSAPNTEMIDWKEQMQIYSTFPKTKDWKGGSGQVGQLAEEELRKRRRKSWIRGSREETLTGFTYSSGPQ